MSSVVLDGLVGAKSSDWQDMASTYRRHLLSLSWPQILLSGFDKVSVLLKMAEPQGHMSVTVAN